MASALSFYIHTVRKLRPWPPAELGRIKPRERAKLAHTLRRVVVVKRSTINTWLRDFDLDLYVINLLSMFRMMNASNRSSPWSPLDDKLGLSSLLLPSSLAEEMERLFINETTAMPPISPSAISNSNTNFGTLNQISLAQMAQTLQRNDSPSSPSAAPMTSSTSSVFMPNNMLDYQTMMRTRRRLGSGDSVGGSSSGSSLTPPGSDLITDFR